MSGKRAKQIRRQLNKAVEGKVRENWAAFASLRLRDRVRLAYWLLRGKKDLPGKGA